MNKYRDNPLEHLEAWLYESLNSDAIPKDVYSVLVNTIKEQVEYHQDGLDKAKSLLALVNGNEEVPTVDEEDLTHSQSDWKNYWEGRIPADQFEEKLKEYGYEYTSIPDRY